MGMTLRQFHDAQRWYFFEKGLQNLWNQYNQIINSEAGSGITGGTTLLSGADITASTGLNKDGTAAATLSGIFASGSEHGATGFDTPPADPAGNVGPHPKRLLPGQATTIAAATPPPMAGFRVSA